MKIFVRKYQEGGAMPEQPQEGGGDPIMELANIAQQALETQDCEAAMQVCEAFVQLLSQAGGGAPAPAPAEEEPVFRRGGRLVRRLR